MSSFVEPPTLSSSLAEFYSNMASFSTPPSTTPVPFPPTPELFNSLHVAKSMPGVFFGVPPPQGGIPSQEADPPPPWSLKLRSLSSLDLSSSSSSSSAPSLITVNVTPSHGYGDYHDPRIGIDDSPRFVMPLEERMLLSTFLSRINSPSQTSAEVLYYSLQNDNLRSSSESISNLPPSLGIPLTLPYISSSLPPTCTLDAVNLWIGDGRATTSLHKDPYHNVYHVAKGTKIFHLLPEWTGGLMEEKDLITATYVRSKDGKLSISDLTCPSTGRKVFTRWITNTLHPTLTKPQPNNKLCTPIPELLQQHVSTFTVRENETIYVPPGWYHAVESSGVSVAVNYWFDREYDEKYNLVQLAIDVQRAAGRNDRVEQRN
mmetsp:Transcript_14302/g.29393  ORF Transcript_14302/g.29393 Transcript_14302/m.29393 type:complete len:374 (+) Transcript_14302:124-1245(+)